MKISVIVPIYNAEKYLSKCIESILNQTFENLEVILVNDGSTDISAAICDIYAQKDSRVKLIYKDNGGLSSARNAGIDIASGDYLAFVDSDDWLEPTMYEVLYNNLVKHDADMAICDRKNVYEDESKNIIVPNEHEEILLSQEDAFKMIFSSNDKIRLCAWNKLYKKRIFDNIRYPAGHVYEDIYIISEILLQCNLIHITTIPLYNYLKRSDSISGGGYKKHKLDSMFATQRNLDIIREVYPQHDNNVRLNLCKRGYRLLDDLLASGIDDPRGKKLLVDTLRRETWYVLRNDSFKLKRKVSAIFLLFGFKAYKFCYITGKNKK